MIKRLCLFGLLMSTCSAQVKPTPDIKNNCNLIVSIKQLREKSNEVTDRLNSMQKSLNDLNDLHPDNSIAQGLRDLKKISDDHTQQLDILQQEATRLEDRHDVTRAMVKDVVNRVTSLGTVSEAIKEGIKEGNKMLDDKINGFIDRVEQLEKVVNVIPKVTVENVGQALMDKLDQLLGRVDIIEKYIGAVDAALEENDHGVFDNFANLHPKIKDIK